jgi:hypothetical protein
MAPLGRPPYSRRFSSFLLGSQHKRRIASSWLRSSRTPFLFGRRRDTKYSPIRSSVRGTNATGPVTCVCVGERERASGRYSALYDFCLVRKVPFALSNGRRLFPSSQGAGHSEDDDRRVEDNRSPISSSSLNRWRRKS